MVHLHMFLPGLYPEAVEENSVDLIRYLSLQRSAELWGPDVLRFDPDRFSPERSPSIHRFQWVPFGAGPRMCLGATFAQMSVTLMAATMLQRIRLEPVRMTRA